MRTGASTRAAVGAHPVHPGDRARISGYGTGFCCGAERLALHGASTGRALNEPVHGTHADDDELPPDSELLPAAEAYAAPAPEDREAAAIAENVLRAVERSIRTHDRSIPQRALEL